MAAHQAPPSLGFSRQEHWSGLPFPSPMHESEKWKWSRSVVSDSLRPHGLQPTRLPHPWDFPGKSTVVGCHCLLWKKPLAWPESPTCVPNVFCPCVVSLATTPFSSFLKWLFTPCFQQPSQLKCHAFYELFTKPWDNTSSFFYCFIGFCSSITELNMLSF